MIDFSICTTNTKASPIAHGMLCNEIRHNLIFDGFLKILYTVIATLPLSGLSLMRLHLRYIQASLF